MSSMDMRLVDLDRRIWTDWPGRGHVINRCWLRRSGLHLQWLLHHCGSLLR
ncbi:MAG: hypothetical protein ACKO7Z_09125 [Cyanobacteriota bacterium]